MSNRNLDPNRLLRRLYNGFYRRRDLPGGSAREATDAQLLATLIDLVDNWMTPPVEQMSRTPPRSVAVAMALAIHSQPHIAATLGRERIHGTEDFGGPAPRTPERALLVRSETLSAALGLPRWEIDELREEVDRRASRVFKMRRVVRWLWDRYRFPSDDPAPLFRLLFPGLRDRSGKVAVARRGTQLYAVVDQDPAPPADALYLGWKASSGDDTYPPIGSFRSKYVEGDLRRAIGRAVGAEDIEVIALLDRMVCIVPRQGAGGWMMRDTWRASGASLITELASSYPASAWLTWPLWSHDVSIDGWMLRRGDEVVPTDLQPVLDHLISPRVTEMLRQCYGHLLSELATEVPGAAGPVPRRPRDTDLDLYDMAGHIRGITRPLAAWATSPSTARHVARQLDAPEAEVRRALGEVAEGWSEHLASAWCAAPGSGSVRSVQTLLTSHMIAARSSLRALYHRPADPRGDHRAALLLFAGHYYGSTPLDRLWTEASANETWPPSRAVTTDVVGDYFWATWRRVLDAIDDDPPTVSPSEPTFGPF